MLECSEAFFGNPFESGYNLTLSIVPYRLPNQGVDVSADEVNPLTSSAAKLTLLYPTTRAVHRFEHFMREGGGRFKIHTC